MNWDHVHNVCTTFTFTIFKKMSMCEGHRVESQSTDSPTSFKFLTHLKKVFKSTAISRVREGDLELPRRVVRAKQASAVTHRKNSQGRCCLEPCRLQRRLVQFRPLQGSLFCQKNQIPVVTGKAIACLGLRM
jgi:hypothetical protein